MKSSSKHEALLEADIASHVSRLNVVIGGLRYLLCDHMLGGAWGISAACRSRLASYLGSYMFV